jgi:thiol-disulfide isomerase/thioredoxin
MISMKTSLIIFALVLLALAPGRLIAADAESAKPASKEKAGSAAGDDLSKFKTADELWAHIQKLQQGPAEQPKSPEEAQAVIKGLITNIDAALAEFFKRFPDDARKWDAKLMQIEIGSAKTQFGMKGPSEEESAKMLTEIAEANDAPKQARAQARLALVSNAIEAAHEKKDEKALDALDTKIGAFAKEFPDHPAVGELRMAQADLLAESSPAKAESLLKDLAKDKNPETAAAAQGKLGQIEMMKKPLDLKFTAIDGAEIDFGKLRGKVVLLDFWATWCGPCVGEVPHVVEAYKKMHDKGFEIVGISLDNDKQALLDFTKQKGMTWPQFFDGKGWRNEVSSKFGINSIPAMWLINKKGMIVSTNARDDLAGKVEKLLGE